MSQLRHKEEELRSVDVDVVIVTFEVSQMAQAYVERSGLQWPLLIDSERRLYAAYGMERKGWGKLLSPRSMWAYLKLFFTGRKFRWATDDVHQMGGDVLVDPSGIVRLHHVSSEPADRPKVDSLLELCRENSPPKSDTSP